MENVGDRSYERALIYENEEIDGKLIQKDERTARLKGRGRSLYMMGSQLEWINWH